MLQGVDWSPLYSGTATGLACATARMALPVRLTLLGPQDYHVEESGVTSVENIGTAETAWPANHEGGPTDPLKKPRRPYSTVIYFHGMGSQRRHAEVSGLVEALERHDRELNGALPGGRIKDVRGLLEPSRLSPDKTVPYVRLDYVAGDEGHLSTTRFRFYEVYWAPITAAGVPLWQVVSWLAGQVLNPWRALRSPWRARRRYRTAVLYDLWYRRELRRYYSQTDLLTLLKAYDGFEGSRARADHRYGKGSFREFCAYLEARAWEAKRSQKHGASAQPDDLDSGRLVELAKEWSRQYKAVEWMNAIVLVSLLVGLLTVFALLAAVLVGLMQAFFPGAGTPQLAGLFSLLSTVLGLIGVRLFFQDYLGDVVFWSTYEETDERYKKRSEILACGAELLRHVLADDACERVAIVAHSLGSAIAYDTLLELGRYNRGRVEKSDFADHQPLRIDKIDQLITYGSPVDKIHYFFQNDPEERHRYHRVLEQVRGDMALPPWTTNRHPRIHWINFFDSADIISGPIQTPQPLEPAAFQLDSLRVDNVQVSNGRLLPMSAHVTYLDNPEVLPVLFDCVLTRKCSFALLADEVRSAGTGDATVPEPERPADTQHGPNYKSIFLEHYYEDRGVQLFQALVLAAFWLLALALGLFGLLGPAMWPEYAYGFLPELLKWSCLSLALVGAAYLLMIRLLSLHTRRKYRLGPYPRSRTQQAAGALLSQQRSSDVASPD